MTKKQKLELTWIGKENRPKLEPRILLEDREKSHHAPHRVTDHDLFDNRLIFGDNLLALKALEQEFTGKIKCIYIDPPYNTGSAFEHYDDGIEHSLWLSLMRDRLELLRQLLSVDGSIWINLDDNEAHYCKVLCDEVFGRANFLANVIWEKSDSPRMDAQFFSTRHDHILIFAKDISMFQVNKLDGNAEGPADHYDKIDEQGRPYYLKPLRAMGGEDSRADRPTLFFPLTAPDGTKVLPIRKDGSEGRWRWGVERTESDKHLIEWVKGRSGWTPYYRIFGDIASSRPPETIWAHAEVGSNRTSKAEIKAVFGGVKAFDTPKPEGLIQRVLQVGSNPGDWVLDSFAGSGTTGAVAHKMGRRWIMVELGEHCNTHIIPRLKKVIDGEDKGGVTEAVGWKGGGGFRYYHLAPSLLEKDKWGNWVVNKAYNPAMLAQAVCKLEGFIYAPSDSIYWQQGHSTERDFIYVTTQNLSHDQLQALSDEVGEERSLLVLCPAFRGKPDKYPNLTIKKIPKTVLTRCEWGHDDYSLKIENLPKAPISPGQMELLGEEAKS
ncbi:MAG: site-specific DNA-methyltransferase [Nitrospira sp.]|nr:site-specific DNA-methyltransferase [Nitrospira sp.]